jgi:hypothetical protein
MFLTFGDGWQHCVVFLRRDGAGLQQPDWSI